MTWRTIINRLYLATGAWHDREMEAKDIIKFWFEEIEEKQHWVKDNEFDRLIENRFGELLKSASLGELWNWRETALGRLAEVIVLDQFSRNIYRDKPQSFAQDPMALALSQEAIRCGANTELEKSHRLFLYMPFMHSESLKVHEEAVRIFTESDLNLEFEIKHKKIIERFGRYPHRNKILGRTSTADELSFLEQPGSSF